MNEFNYASGKRVEITAKQQKQIKKLYNNVLEDIKDQVKSLEGKDNVSSIIRKSYLDTLSKQVKDQMEKVNADVEKQIKSNMKLTATEVVKNNNDVLKKMGFVFNAKTSFSNVPDDIVKEIISGKLYEGKWTLSKAIWTNNKKILSDIDYIVAKGIAENKSSFDIAKDLEQYVDPSKAKKWDWSKVYPGTNKKIDYNAQRLARTMTSHAYQESFVRTTKGNPFFEAYKWLISNSDRVCPICIARSQDDEYGLGEGVYPKDQLPLDHPNGMCTFITVMSKNYDQIADDLVNWYNGTGDKKLNEALDKYSKELKM